MSLDLDAAFAANRPVLLRHCYRMLGSYAEAEDLVQETFERAWRARASYLGDAPVERWLCTIATNACLNALAHRKRRALPQLERAPTTDLSSLDPTEPERWLTPAADERLYPDPEALAESRETVALAFVALLQRVPPRQRAALLLKDVLGWSAAEVGAALDLSIPSVNSALHRGRTAVAQERPEANTPTSEAIQAFVQAWEARDLESLVKRLRDDVTLAMPPYAAWFQGRQTVVSFFQSPRFTAFWSRLARVAPLRANGLPAFAFIHEVDGVRIPHSIMVARFDGPLVAAMTVFIGASNNAGFAFSPDATA